MPIRCSYAKDQLVGEYQIEYSFGTDKLILNADNTYEQRFTDKGGKTYVHQGKWEFEGGRDNQVSLIDAVDVCTPSGGFAGTESHRGYSMRTFAWYYGTVESNENLGLYMRKLR